MSLSLAHRGTLVFKYQLDPHGQIDFARQV